MKKITFITTFIWLILSFSVVAAQESVQYTQQSKDLLEALQKNIKTTALAIAVNETKADKNMADFNYSLSLPEKQYVNLGLLLDLSGADNGYRVVSVTPDSDADRLGIKVKDLIQKINNIDVKHLYSRLVLEMLYNLRPNDKLTLGIESAGNYKEIITTLTGVYVPAITLNIGTENTTTIKEYQTLNEGNTDHTENSCGRVAIFFSPAKPKHLGGVLFKKIDGISNQRERKSAKLSPGKHTLYLYRSLVKGSNLARDGKARPIEIDIKANTTYYLAAQAVSESRWMPIIWKMTEKECNL